DPVQMLDEALHSFERRNLRRVLHHLRLGNLVRLYGGLIRLRQRVTSEPNGVLGHTRCEHQLILPPQVSRQLGELVLPKLLESPKARLVPLGVERRVAPKLLKLLKLPFAFRYVLVVRFLEANGFEMLLDLLPLHGELGSSLEGLPNQRLRGNLRLALARRGDGTKTLRATIANRNPCHQSAPAIALAPWERPDRIPIGIAQSRCLRSDRACRSSTFDWSSSPIASRMAFSSTVAASSSPKKRVINPAPVMAEDPWMSSPEAPARSVCWDRMLAVSRRTILASMEPRRKASMAAIWASCASVLRSSAASPSSLRRPIPPRIPPVMLRPAAMRAKIMTLSEARQGRKARRLPSPYHVSKNPSTSTSVSPQCTVSQPGSTP